MLELKKFSIIKSITVFVIPYILVLALYIQFYGEESPGGGFQAGAIFASCLIVYEIIFGLDNFKKKYPTKLLVTFAIIGTLIYLLTGLLSLFNNNNFLAYKFTTTTNSQKLGIFLVEIGVGFTVSSVMCLIYSIFRK